VEKFHCSANILDDIIRDWLQPEETTSESRHNFRRESEGKDAVKRRNKGDFGKESLQSLILSSTLRFDLTNGFTPSVLVSLGLV
jgi:hypothetical protein